MAMAESNKLFDPKSPPPALKSHRALSQRAAQLSQREPEHEAFGLEPPPRPAEVRAMMCPTAVRTLKEYLGDAETVMAVCERWCTLAGHNKEGRQEAAECGAMEAIVEAIGKHTETAGVVEKAIGALGNLCCGTDGAGLARKQRAADVGALEAVVAGARAHAATASVQENVAATLGNVASNVDDAGLARKQKAVEAGALEVLVIALTTHTKEESVCDFACFALGNLVRGRGDKAEDTEGAARKKRAVEAGALPALVGAMNAHPSSPRVQEFGARAIANITFRNDAHKKLAIDAGATSESLDGSCTARILVPESHREREKDGGEASAAEVS
jgi:hypothetical protein